MIPKYVGNGAYCYANSVSMLLDSIGEEVSPSLIEVLSGLGIGFFMDTKVPIIFFSNFATSPEKGINNALNLLGFGFKESYEDSLDNPPLEKLRKQIEKGPVVIGPIDIAYRKHWGNPQEEGGDHYVLVYKITNEYVWVHDPQEFPSTPIPLTDFLKIWKAENIIYKDKFYHCWFAPKIKKKYSSKERFTNSLKMFKENYEKSKDHPENIKIDEDALVSLADLALNERITADLNGHLIGFAFPVIVRRSLDYANFFHRNKKEKLAQLKEKQAELFSECETLALKSNWKRVSKILRDIALTEKEFKKQILVSFK